MHATALPLPETLDAPHQHLLNLLDRLAPALADLQEEPAALRAAVTTWMQDTRRHLHDTEAQWQRHCAHLRLAASVFAHAAEGIMITSPEGVIEEVNAAFTHITGYSREQVVGRNARLLQSDHQSPEFYRTMWDSLQQKGQWAGEIWNRRATGDVFAEYLTISTIRDSAGAPLHFIGIFSDISQQKAQEQRLQHIAHFDDLTGLPNRVLLADRLHQAMALATRRSCLLALVFMDLDGFKAVNDRCGHAIGDALLTAMAQRLQQILRAQDTLARLGGDEFVAVLMDLPHVEDVRPVLERLRLAAAEPFMLGGVRLHVTLSLGVAFYPQEDAVQAEQLMRQADQAMYQAKLAGKNRCCFFDHEQDRRLRSHHARQAEVQQALQNGEFQLFYQPKVCMRSGALVGLEALLRWQHPERGWRTPGEFLPAVQGTPLAVTLGEWVLETAVTQINTWRAQGLDLAVSVNMDPVHLQQPHFMGWLRALLARHPGVCPNRLELEVVETSALNDMLTVSRLIHDCRAIGVDFALDDFGTGYSSLTYLRRLPAAVLKIDQSFVRGILDDRNDVAMLEGVLGLARAFRTQVIAEGVESVAHGELLLQLGCEWGQGYAVAAAMAADAVPAWQARWQPPARWTNTRRIDPSDLPLLTSRVANRCWLRAVREHLRGARPHPPEMETGLHELHRWRHNQVGEHPMADAALARLAPLYARLEAHVEQLLHAPYRPPNAIDWARLDTLHSELDAHYDALLRPDVAVSCA